MTKEQIETQAKDWAKWEITKSRTERAEKSFIAGARWRINSVWHEDKHPRKEVKNLITHWMEIPNFETT